jgi:anti-sigma B factor antagonist
MSADAAFAVTVISGLPVVTTPKEIDISNGDALRAALLATAEAGHATVVVDMADTALCDTAGLSALVRWHQRLTAEGGELRLVMRDPSLIRLFLITGIDRVIPVFAALEDALSELPAIAIRAAPAEPSGLAAGPGRSAS